MGDVVPFKRPEPKPAPEQPKGPPTENEMLFWAWMTKGWSDQMKQLITPREWDWSRRGK